MLNAENRQHKLGVMLLFFTYLVDYCLGAVQVTLLVQLYLLPIISNSFSLGFSKKSCSFSIALCDISLDSKWSLWPFPEPRHSISSDPLADLFGYTKEIVSKW